MFIAIDKQRGERVCVCVCVRRAGRGSADRLTRLG